jgi:hypothetical protein
VRAAIAHASAAWRSTARQATASRRRSGGGAACSECAGAPHARRASARSSWGRTGRSHSHWRHGDCCHAPLSCAGRALIRPTSTSPGCCGSMEAAVADEIQHGVAHENTGVSGRAESGAVQTSRPLTITSWTTISFLSGPGELDAATARYAAAAMRRCRCSHRSELLCMETSMEFKGLWHLGHESQLNILMMEASASRVMRSWRRIAATFEPMDVRRCSGTTVHLWTRM